MKIKILKKLMLLLSLSLVPMQMMAWGTNGHRITGQIAYSYLTPKTKLALQKILGNESLALAGNWADFIRSDNAYSYTTNWHYLDFDKPYTQAEMRDYLLHDTNTDAYTKLKSLMADFKKPGISAETKLFDLHMIIHLIEDLHQPMHVAHADDKGGNDFKLQWFGKPTNLHTLWDSELLEFQQLSYTEYTNAINFTTASQRAEWQKAGIEQWMFESHEITERLYTEIKAGDNLSYKYSFTHIATLNEQLLKGGVRLAGVLNDLLGK